MSHTTGISVALYKINFITLSTSSGVGVPKMIRGTSGMTIPRWKLCGTPRIIPITQTRRSPWIDNRLGLKTTCGKFLKHIAGRQAPCGKFRKQGRLLALQLYQRGIPAKKVQDALALVAVRRMIRPADAQPMTIVRSLAYFLQVIEEVLEMEVGEEYFQYARQKLQRLRTS